jgi:hypothetical protein
MKNVMSCSKGRLFYVATKIHPQICGRFCLTQKKMLSALSQLAPVVDCTPLSSALISVDIHPAINLASFTHMVCMWANGVKFAHHSLYNPKISMLLKAVHKGFCKRCPNLSKMLIL